MIVAATKIDAANPEKLKKLAAMQSDASWSFTDLCGYGGRIDELKWRSRSGYGQTAKVSCSSFGSLSIAASRPCRTVKISTRFPSKW